MARASDGRTPATTKTPTLGFTRTAAEILFDLFEGDDEVVFEVGKRDGRLFAFVDEYPDEGGVWLDPDPNEPRGSGSMPPMPVEVDQSKRVEWEPEERPETDDFAPAAEEPEPVE